MSLDLIIVLDHRKYAPTSFGGLPTQQIVTQNVK